MYIKIMTNQQDQQSKQTFIEITVVGKDHKGVVAEITSFIFNNGGNIEGIKQNVVRGLFGMHLIASFIELNKDDIDRSLERLSKKLDMEIKVHYQEPNRKYNIAILVSKEDHCLKKILELHRQQKIDANISIIIGTEHTLENIAKDEDIPFITITHIDQSNAEYKILELIEKYNIDLIVLARYMRILTPNFVWRYPNRIINIHPSLLPAFPGAYAYVQAYERGAKIIGCTAHFVTEDLDQGPIILQDCFRVEENDDLEIIKSKGRSLEASTLAESVKLFLDRKLETYWGKVHILDNPRF